MNARSMKPWHIRLVKATVTAGLVAILFAMIYSMTRAANPSDPAYRYMSQPSTARQVAAQMDCKHLHVYPQTGAHTPLVIEAANCWLHGKKYGLNTFESMANRDKWIKMAEPFGVRPKWQAATWVMYPSTSK